MFGVLFGIFAGAASASVNLSGTTGAGAIGDTDVVTTPSTASAGWTFNSSGDLTRYSGTAYNSDEWYGVSGGVAHATPDQTYYIRATADSGDAVTSGTLNTWLALSSSRTWYWSTSSGILDGTIKIEIATDAGGTNIVATGYYGGYAESTP